MEIISSSHVNVKKILNPDGRIRRSIVLFDIYGFKPFWKLMFHDLIGEAYGVCGPSICAMSQRRLADI